MKIEVAKKIKEYFDNGHIVLIQEPKFKDGMVKKIYEVNGELVYDSRNFTSRPLREVLFNYVSIIRGY